MIDGRFYVGSMPDAVKAKDLRRDPRCCLLTPLADKDDLAGEAKAFCRAREVDDTAEWERVRTAFLDLRGFDIGDSVSRTSSSYAIVGGVRHGSKATIGAPPPGPRTAA